MEIFAMRPESQKSADFCLPKDLLLVFSFGIVERFFSGLK